MRLNMVEKRKSESLFSEGESIGNIPVDKRQIPPIRSTIPQESMQEQRKKAKEDYIFKNELKEKFQQQVQIAQQSVEQRENQGILRQIHQMKEFVSIDENIIMKRTNERRKRHYTLDGNVKVYCYVKNNWPKMVVKALTIDLNEKIPIPPLGPFSGEDEFLVEVIFNPITIGVKRKIEPFIYDPVDKYSSKITINSEEYKKLVFAFCFQSWNIPVQLNKVNGILDEDSRNILSKHFHPILFDVIAREFISLNEVSDNEIQVLDKQCERLFAKKSQGIPNPLEGIRLYCEASSFAKEFSLSGKSLEDLPIRIGTLIRHVSQKGNEIHMREFDTNRKKPKSTKAIGRRK